MVAIFSRRALSRLTMALPLAARPRLRDLVDLQPVDLAEVGEEEE